MISWVCDYSQQNFGFVHKSKAVFYSDPNLQSSEARGEKKEDHNKYIINKLFHATSLSRSMNCREILQS